MNVVEIVFSPTGGTEKVSHIIAKHWSESPTKIDLSEAKTDFTQCKSLFSISTCADFRA